MKVILSCFIVLPTVVKSYTVNRSTDSMHIHCTAKMVKYCENYYQNIHHVETYNKNKG